METESFDVIVVGAGGSGLAAAFAAAQRGGRVILLERNHQPGGTTGIAIGSFTAAGTMYQRQAGIEDQVEDHVVDAGKFAEPQIEAKNNSSLRSYFLSEAATTLHWLSELGIHFVGPYPEPPNRMARMHNVVPCAKSYIATLQLALQRAGGKLVCNMQVDRLLRNDDGRVIGVRASGLGRQIELRATRGVILAAGDYASNQQLIARYQGERFRQIEAVNPTADGLGHQLAEQVGAQLVNMDVAYGPELRFVPSSRRPFQQWLPAGGIWSRVMAAVARRLPRQVMQAMIKRLLVTWQHPENALFDDGAILVNADGRRFVNETIWPDREIGVASQKDKVAYILLDGRLIERFSRWPHFVSTAPDIAYAYAQDYRRLRPDVTRVASTLEELAHRCKMDAESLKQTVTLFNQYVLAQAEDPLGRTSDRHCLGDGPWMLLGPLKAYFTTTEGGVAVNQRLEVLDQQGDVVPGLYAVGQNGLGGMILWGHGLHIAWALTSGRLAGVSVMQASPGRESMHDNAF